MGKQHKFNYIDRLPSYLGGGKAKATIRCGSLAQYKNELRDMLNACRRELDRFERLGKRTK